MTYENANGTLAEMSSIAESTFCGEDNACDGADGITVDASDLSSNAALDLPDVDGGADDMPLACSDEEVNERAEYERLIRTRFKEFYTFDTQKMINKRFKRYKAMEQRLLELEEQAAKMSEREAKLNDTLARECDRVRTETERRVIAEMNATRQRPSENGYAPRRASAPFNVSSLTKSQRADIAKRAFGGEKISF